MARSPFRSSITFFVFSGPMGHLTRRSLLARAAAGGGALVIPASARALAEPGDAVYAMTLRGTRGPIRVPQPFDLLAVEAGPSARVEVRVRPADGAWSPWL